MEEIPQKELETTPAVESTVEVKPKEKVNGCLVAFFVFIGIFLLLILGVYLGYRKISKDLKTQVDLNVEYTSDDVVDISSLVTITPENYLDVKDGIDVSFSSAQVTAMLNAQVANSMFSNSQVRLNTGNVEISTVVESEILQGRKVHLPLYASVDIEEITSSKQDLDIKEIRVGLLKLPSWIEERVTVRLEDWLERIVRENLSSIGFSSMHFTDGHVDIEGLLLDELK